MSLQELKKTLDAAIQKEKDQKMGTVVLDSQIAGKKSEIIRLEQSVKDLNQKLISLDEDFKAKNKTRIEVLEKREREVSLKELEVQKTLEDARLQRNIAVQEAAYSMTQSKASKTISDQLQGKFAQVKELASKLAEIVG